MGTRPIVSVLLALVVMGCAPGSPERAGTNAQGAASAEPDRPPVTLTIAVQNEPRDFMSVRYGGSPSQGGTQHGRYVVNNFLVIQDETGAWVPQLAAELPSIENGTWRINPDGSMDVTWRLRPNVRWHDGTPFTSADLAFTLGLTQDPELPWPARDRLVDAAVTPDPLTFVLHWVVPFARADEDPIAEPLPRHLLEEIHRTDKAAFASSPYLSTEFVGVGPYRLVDWVRGSHMEFVRFDDYWQGRPPLDRVFIRFLGDPNTMIANILAGEVDLVLPTAVDVDAALDVKRRWEGTGNQVRLAVQEYLWFVQFQSRPEYARPANGLINRPVRQAFYHAVDRQNLAEVMTAGLAPTADSWIMASHPMRAQLESAIPQYPYDVRRAADLLAQAGLTRRADGMLADQGSGAPFETEAWARVGRGESKVVSVVADNWSALGAQVKQNIVPAARAGDAEYINTFPGSFVNGQSKAFDSFFEDKLHSRNVPMAANRWQGTNRGGYSNPRGDALLDELVRTIDRRERLPLLRAAVEEQLGDLAIMPLFWDVSPVLMLKGVEGPITADKDVVSKFYLWRKS